MTSFSIIFLTYMIHKGNPFQPVSLEILAISDEDDALHMFLSSKL